MSGPPTLAELLTEGLAPHERRLEARAVAELTRGWRGPADREAACLHLGAQVQTLAERIDRVRVQQGDFVRRYAAVTSEVARRQVLLDFARELGATPRELRGDRRALKRWLGPDALTDRVSFAVGRDERMLVFALRALGRLAAHHVAGQREAGAAWRALRIEAAVQPLLRWSGDPRVRTEAFHALADSLRPLPPAAATQAMQPQTVAFVYRAALDSGLDVWVQREALELLRAIAPQQIGEVLERRLRKPGEGDDFFVRRRAVELIGLSLDVAPQGAAVLEVAAADPSAHVRQGVAEVLPAVADATVREVWPRLGLTDLVVPVRAAALLQLPRLATRTGLFDTVLAWAEQALRDTQQTPFALRVALRAAEEGALALGGQARQRWEAALLPAIEDLHVQAQALPVRRWAAQTRERMWFIGDARAQALAERLLPATRAAPGGKPRPLALDAEALGDALDEARAGRVLAVLAQLVVVLGLERRGRGLQAWRGHRFGFRAWRFLHEWRHPSPDKRQAHRHTIGRLFRGTLRAPSAILAELAQTKVPGEPLQMGSEAGWRPYLPLVDELISLLDEQPARGPLRLFTAEGVTEVHAPRELKSRLAARGALTRRFAHYAAARNWSEGSATHPNTYLRMLGGLGFRFRFEPHARTRADEAVTRFFAFSPLALLPWPEMRARLRNYFFSAYDNTLHDLALFTAAGIAAFVAHHALVNLRMRRARQAIPLVVGGWGTRGKSGTERLKAAMFNALGYSIVSKTTGCEAMFLYSKPYGVLREMFLFRPYDKATIWEQFNVVRMASRLGCEVFLWECMALTPSFVRLMQRAWMRDDVATLTNTFPDHEDLQGPAGIDIPRVMTNFIPRGRLLLTTEEQMRPILQDAADALGTTLKGVGWLESGLIAPDVLARFPYQEHPDNIALVAALGAELGIGRDFALKAMADRVVPDLGVLKTFEPARVSARVLEFSNGMSANERFGCLGNWTRLGFDRQDPLAEPGVMISTVVNNRADRIARSRVFAGVIAEDIQADLHVLIGSNVDGLRGYIQEAWDAHAATLTLWPAQPVEGGPQAVLRQLARRYRVVHTEAQVAARLRVMLAGIDAPETLAAHAGQPQALEAALQGLGLPHAQEVMAFHTRDVTVRGEYAALEQRVAQAGAAADAALDAALRQQMGAWFNARIVVVHDYYASGDAVIGFVRDATPPGFHNRVMGIQNIKGTGLDFVYRWLAWDACVRACRQLLSRDPLVQRAGLLTLTGFREFGLLTHELVLTTLAAARNTPFGQQPQTRAELQAVADNEVAGMAEVQAQMQAVRAAGWVDKLFGVLEGLLDATDAIRRRRRADRIYKDLVARRIGEAKAVVELQALTQRQKGGWLQPLVLGWMKRLRRRRV